MKALCIEFSPWRISLALLFGAFLLSVSSNFAQATVYGCSIAGQWQCYPSPQRCYKNASYLAVVKFPNYQTCKARGK